MADIPNVPGVPALSPRANGALPALATTQLQDTQNTGKNWGVFLNGKQVVTPDTFVSIDYRQGWALADYPVENGAFESYNKVDLPFDVRVRFASGGSKDNRENLLRQVTSIAEDLNFYDVVTPEVVYKQCNVQHYDYRRTSTNGVGMLMIELWLLEIRTVPRRGANVQFPSSASVANGGFVSSQAATTLENTILQQAITAGKVM